MTIRRKRVLVMVPEPVDIEATLRQRLAGVWTPEPPTEHDDTEYHRLYALWRQESR